MKEKYKGNIIVAFDDIPPVRLQTINPEQKSGIFTKLALATKRRVFTLDRDWVLKLDNVNYAQELNGKIKIPDIDEQGKKINFDGASIPFPWLVSVLTFGIFRPLGVMLTGSIVHDFAYKYGKLYKNDGSVIPIKRHIADYLFRDIVGTVNGLQPVGFIGWFFVRLGWFLVKYNSRRRGGKIPFWEYFSLAVIIGLVVFKFGNSFTLALIFFLVGYLTFYLLSVFQKK